MSPKVLRIAVSMSCSVNPPPVPDPLGVEDGLGLGVGLSSGVGETEGDGLGEGEGLSPGVGDGLGDGDAEGEGVGEAEGVGDGVAEGVGEGVGEAPVHITSEHRIVSAFAFSPLKLTVPESTTVPVPGSGLPFGSSVASSTTLQLSPELAAALKVGAPVIVCPF